MGSPLGPLDELKTSVIPNLSDNGKLWKRFACDTYCFTRSEYIYNLL